MTRLHWPEAGITLSVYRPAKDERPVIAAFVIEDGGAWREWLRDNGLFGVAYKTGAPGVIWPTLGTAECQTRYMRLLSEIRERCDDWIDKATAEEEQRERARAQEMCDA